MACLKFQLIAQLLFQYTYEYTAAMAYNTAIKLIIIQYCIMYFKLHIKIKSIFKVISWLNTCRSFLVIQNVLNNYIIKIKFVITS